MIKLVFFKFSAFIFCLNHFLRDFFKARAGIQKYSCSFFGSNENFEICFQDLLTFNKHPNKFNTSDNGFNKYISIYCKKNQA